LKESIEARKVEAATKRAAEEAAIQEARRAQIQAQEQAAENLRASIEVLGVISSED
jgi:soluble cytochrome b562